MRHAALLLAVASSIAWAAPLPPTPKKPVVSSYHGVKISDDYQWLENADDPAVKAWSEAENQQAREALAAIPFHDAVKQRIGTLIRSSGENWFDLSHHGGLWFALKSEPSRQQPYLVSYSSLDDKASEKTLLDPNRIDPTGKTAIDFYKVSNDGQRLAVSLSKNGSESGDLHVYDVASGQEIGEVIPRVNNGTAGGSVAFAPDGSGFWYTRYPRGSERPPEDAGFYQQVYFHKLGEPTESDRYELGKSLPRIAEIVLHAKDDGRWLLAQVLNGDGGDVAYYLRSTAAEGQWTQVSTFADKAVEASFGTDDTLYLLSRKNAPKGKVLKLPLARPLIAKASVLVKPGDGVIESLLATPHKLYVSDLLGGPSRVRVFDLPGGQRGQDLPLLEVSTAHGMVADEGDGLVFGNVSFVTPNAWYRFDGQKATRTALVSTSIADYSDSEVVLAFATSKDGTKVPLSIIRRKGTKLDGTNPTILYGYGGYNISMTPSFSSSRRAWLEQGGVYAIASLRGGGEYGEEWHLGGNLLNKQNGYDDFYACEHWLVNKGYTQPAKLAISGASNGGLLMGVALTQHPEMVRAVTSRVGIYDMLRVENTQNGAFNVTEFGTVKTLAGFKSLLGYSPLHHVQDGVQYPAVLLTTGANDPRVDSWHSKKFAARLQASGTPNPVLLRINSEGHGMGTNLDEVIAETADLYAFTFQQLGLTPTLP